MDEVKVKIINRGRGRVAMHQGYQYYRHCVYKNGNSLWKCNQYKNTKCVGSITLSTDETMLKLKPHINNCQPDDVQNTIDIIINEACLEAVDGREPAPKIFNKALQHINEKGYNMAAKKPVPSFKNKKSAIYKRRNEKAGVKKTSTTNIEEVEVPHQFNSFLLADYKNGNMRIIIFCSQHVRQYIKTVKEYFMDGTFKTCPTPFRQLFTIHGDIGSDINNTNIIPMIYAFMTHQNKEAYIILFHLIKAQLNDWKPQKIMIDFEEGIIAALKEINTVHEIKGCHFHFYNSLKRKAKQLGIFKDKSHKRIVLLCSSLAYLPEEKILSGWNYITSEIVLEDDRIELEQFQHYFEKFWLKEKMVKMWCNYGELHRTNNVVEGWNYKINTKICKNQGNWLTVLHCLFDDAQLSSFRNRQLEKFNSSTQPKRRKVDREKDNFILKSRLQLLSGDITVNHFLDKILALLSSK